MAYPKERRSFIFSETWKLVMSALEIPPGLRGPAVPLCDSSWMITDMAEKKEREKPIAPRSIFDVPWAT